MSFLGGGGGYPSSRPGEYSNRSTLSGWDWGTHCWDCEILLAGTGVPLPPTGEVMDRLHSSQYTSGIFMQQDFLVAQLCHNFGDKHHIYTYPVFNFSHPHPMDYGRLCFHRSLSVNKGGRTPFIPMGGGSTPIYPDGGGNTPILPTGVPIQAWMGVPPMWTGWRTPWKD